MNYSDFKESTLEEIYSSIRLGLDIYKSCLIACLTDEEITFLDTDPEFNRHVRFHEAVAIRSILEKQSLAMDRNLNQNNSTESRWLLSKMDRKRFGNGPVEVGGSDELPPVSFTNKGEA